MLRSRFVPLVVATLFISSCDLIFAPMLVPRIPEPEPILPILSIEGWVFSSQGLKMLVVPDHSAIAPQFGIETFDVVMSQSENRLTLLGVSAQRADPEVGRPAEVVSQWFPLPPGSYQIENFDGKHFKHIATIDTKEGRGGKAFDTTREPTR